jgi:hypothetical protein
MDAAGRRLSQSGSWNGAASLDVQGGQGMNFVLKNLNVLGTTITISSNLAGSKNLILAPQVEQEMEFDCFGNEPMGWHFDVSTDSDAFLVGWQLFATWISGDPPNQ